LLSQLHPVFVVVGYQHEAIVSTLPPSVQPIYNPDWASGIASSLRAALQAVASYPSIEALCIGLADQPFIGAQSYRRLASAHAQGATLAVATYEGARRNPVLLSRCLWQEAVKLKGDRGAQVLMQDYPVVEVPCEGTGTPQDLDTPEDLAKIREYFSSTISTRS
jgi:molybdenum cofactor cytidylyltransferase/nicotine blue oxidoreductase